jgi:TolB-like protein/DNA-binding winged helix-turn-helix (wHTH) protein/Tfp pilus assembly protein PilF
MPSDPRRSPLRFGVFEVDLAAGDLRRQGAKVKIHDRAFQLLLALLERPGELVTRQELQSRLWPADTFVEFDNNLNNAISRLRDALGDAADNPRFVETVPRRGYRFIAPIIPSAVESGGAEIDGPGPLPQSEPDPPTPPPQASEIAAGPPPAVPRTRLYAGLAVLAMAIIGAIAFVTLTDRRSDAADPSPPARVQSIAVLPFLNLSGNAEHEYLADGLTEALIMELSRIRALRVTSRTSAMHYKGTAKHAPEVAKELKVDALVEGSIVREGDRLRVTVQLINAPIDTHLWSSTYDRELGSLLTLQREVATAIAGEIRLTVVPEAPVRTRELNGELSQVYLRGRHLLNRRTEPELQHALVLFQQVVDKEPNYAPVHAAIAATWEALAGWGNFLPPIDGLPKAKAAATRALDLDPSMGEAHTRLAFAIETIDFDLPAAERSYKRAIELDPSYALVYQRYANFLSRTRRGEEAFEMAARAQQLDPFELEVNVQYASRLAERGRRDEAVRHMLQTIDLDPTYYDAWVHLAYLYESQNRIDEQIAAAMRSVDLSNRAPHALHVLARTYARNGRVAEAQKLADEMNRTSRGRNALELARLHLVLKQPARGLFWLQQACVERSVGMAFFQLAHTERIFDPIRNDSRFQQVLACAGVKTPQ